MRISIRFEQAEYHAFRFVLKQIFGQYKTDEQLFKKAIIVFVNYSMRRLDTGAPNNPMQATGLRPSDADGQSLSSDSSGEPGSTNPPRA